MEEALRELFKKYRRNDCWTAHTLPDTDVDGSVIIALDQSDAGNGHFILHGIYKKKDGTYRIRTHRFIQSILPCFRGGYRLQDRDCKDLRMVFKRMILYACYDENRTLHELQRIFPGRKIQISVEFIDSLIEELEKNPEKILLA